MWLSVTFLFLLIAFPAMAQTYVPPAPELSGSPIVPGIVCDDRTDDAPAINAAAAMAARNVRIIENGTLVGANYISLPPGKQCLVRSGIVLPSGVGYDGNGSSLDCTQLTTGSACLTIEGQAVANGNNAAPLRNINLYGTTFRSVNGVLMERPNASIYSLNAGNFNAALSFGNSTYVDAFYDVRLFDSNYGIYYAGGLSNSGEELTFVGGSIANDSWLVYASGGAFQFYGMSFDDVSPFPVAGTFGRGYGAFYSDSSDYRITDSHIEKPGGIPFQFEGAAHQNCSAYSHIVVNATNVYLDAETDEPLIDINGGVSCGGAGPYAKFSDVFLSGFSNAAASPPGPWVTGNYASNVKFCGVTNANSGYISGIGACP